MSVIETVRGPVPTTALGPTLTHEHIFIMQPEALQGHAFGPGHWDEAQRVHDAIAILTAVRTAGIRTIVDPTVPGLGRYIPRIQTVNRGVDLSIVVAMIENPRRFFGGETTAARPPTPSAKMQR